MKRFFAFIVLSVVVGATAARADTFDAVYDGPTFTLTDVTTNKSFTTFCVDTADNVFTSQYTNMTGTLYTAPPYPSDVNDATNGLANGHTYDIWGGPGFVSGSNHVTDGVGTPGSGTTLGNLAFIVTQIWETGLYATQGWSLSDIQNALWYTMDSEGADNGVYEYMKANYNSANDATYEKGLVLWVPGVDTSYVPGGARPGVGDPLQYQVLIGYAPEPSSMAIAGLGALGLVGYGLKRKRA
jgi:hypothetical protein